MTEKSDGPSEEEIEEVLDGMVAKGLLTCEVKDGKKIYSLTVLGAALAEAKEQEDSEEKNRN
jgi:DNA-binding PadR family transcriptional regulator